MVKFTHFIVMSFLVFWLAVSGCVGNDTDEKDEGPASNSTESSNSSVNNSANKGLTEADVKEFDENIAGLEDLLVNSSLEEEIDIEEL
ncbi:MAG: hypothetical protein QM426_10075 [Euryarchaeota archaeon]|nr:hypothetical protein [Euryarchaeota archaeon]